MLQNEWLILFMIVVGAIIIVLQNVYSNQFSTFLRSPFSLKKFNEFLYELNGRPNLFLYLLEIIGVSIISVYLFYLKEFLQVHFLLADKLELIFYVFVIIVIWIVFKTLVLRIIQFVFKISEIVNSHIIILHLFNAINGLILFPFLLMISYLDANLITASLWLLIAILLLLFIERQIFLVLILFRSGFSIFTILLYLCALEIVPVLVLTNVVLLLVN
jgi:hypothetical protein